MTTTTLTVQWKHIRLGWQDRTVVAVVDAGKVEQEIELLRRELPAGIAARIKIEVPGAEVRYTW